MITEKQYIESSKKIRIIRGILEKPLADYSINEVEFMNEEIFKHETIVNRYNIDRFGGDNSDISIIIEVPVLMTLENYNNLINLEPVTKFKEYNFNSYVHASEVRHVVDIDIPMGIFVVGDKTQVSHVMISQGLRPSEIKELTNKAVESGVQPWDTLEILNSIKNQISKLYETSYS